MRGNEAPLLSKWRDTVPTSRLEGQEECCVAKQRQDLPVGNHDLSEQKVAIVSQSQGYGMK